MTDKPEALYLAEVLENATGPSFTRSERETIAAELRRLHASCEDYARHKERQDKRVIELLAQRDELLDALKVARSIIGHPDDAHSQLIDAAIAKVTGEQK